MTAHTTFDRQPARRSARVPMVVVPLTERRWFRVAGMALVVTWLMGCAVASALLVK